MIAKKSKTKKDGEKTKGVKVVAKKKVKVELPELEEMLKAGFHFGHRTSRWNSRMKPYIFASRNNVHIIDLEKAVVKLEEALKFIKGLKKKKAVILFVGTKVPAKEIVKQAAQKTGMPYAVEKWTGGTLTNFETIKERLSYFRDLEKKKKMGELQKYTKKERHDFDIELERLERKFGGIKSMEKLPDALFVVDVQREKIAVKEAETQKIPIIGLCDTDANPDIIDYPVPCNDDATSALKLVLDAVVKALK